MAGAIDGLDTLVFAGGIGEHSAEVRMRICERLGHLGVILDPDANSANRSLISSSASRVRVRVMITDEQAILAKEAHLLLSAAVHTSEGTRHD